MSENKVGYAEWFEKHYSAVLGMLRYFFTQLADEAVEIAGRSVALAAPLPNAISMYNISQKELGYNWVAAFAFAAMIELIVFFLVEVALYMWSGYLKDPRRYKIPFQASIVVVLVAVVVVMAFVGLLEPHKIMAALPIISLCSFVGIGLKRWHERNQSVNVQGVKSSVKSSVKSTGESVKFDTATTVDPEPTKIDSRRQTLLKMLEEIDGQGIDALNKSALAKRLDVSRPTLNTDLAALESIGKLTLNGHVKINSGG
jgi:hypothetical protein